MPQPAEYMDAASLVSLAVLCVLSLRKLILRTEGLEALRVILITALLWVGAWYLFALACSDMFRTGCDVVNFKSDVYTCSEF